MPDIKKICIINFADGIYRKGQERLADSLKKVGFTGDVLLFTEPLKGWPKHEDVPWGFKPYAFEEASKKAYDMALWMDAAGIAVRPLDHIFEMIARNGVFIFSRYASSVGEWSSDLALKAFGMTREEAFRIPEISASFIGINFNDQRGKKFLEEWKRYADEKLPFLGVNAPHTIRDSMANKDRILSKNPKVQGHRHDQTAASIIVRRLGLPIRRRYVFDIQGEAHKGKKYADYIPLDTIIVHDRDIKTENFIKGTTSTLNKTGAAKIIQTLKNGIYSVIRYGKDTIKWYLVLKKKYKNRPIPQSS